MVVQFALTVCVQKIWLKLSNERDDFQYQYVDIRAEGITKEDLQQKAGKPVETVPQIFVDQQHIGGYTDFAAWVKENLDA